MKKALFVLGALFLFASFLGANDFYVGENLQKLDIVSSPAGGAYVIYLQNDVLHCLYQNENGDLIEHEHFEMYNGSMKALTIHDSAEPAVLFLGKNNNEFGLFYSLLDYDSFCEMKFTELNINPSIIEKPAASYYGNYIDFTFIADGRLYLCKININANELESFSEISGFGDVVTDYVYVNDAYSYGYYLTDKICLFKFNEGLVEKNMINDTTYVKDTIKIIETYEWYPCFIYENAVEKNIYSFKNGITKILTTDKNIVLPELCYNNFGEQYKVTEYTDRIRINDNYQTELFCDYVEYMPAGMRNTCILLHDDYNGWSFVTTDYSTTTIKNLAISKNDIYLQPYFDSEKIILYFADITENKIVGIDYETQKIQADFQMKNLCLNEDYKARDYLDLLIIHEKKSDYIVNTNGDVFVFGPYKQISYSNVFRSIFMVMYTENNFISVTKITNEEY